MRFDIIFNARANSGMGVFMTSQPVAALTAPDRDYLLKGRIFARLCKNLHTRP